MGADETPVLEWHCRTCGAKEPAPYPDYTLDEWDSCTRCKNGVMRVRVKPEPKHARHAWRVMVTLAALMLGCATPPPPRADAGGGASNAQESTLPPIRVYMYVSKQASAGVLSGVEGWAYAMQSVRAWEVVSDPNAADVHILDATADTACLNTKAPLACVDRVGGLWNRDRDDDPRRIYMIEGQYEHGAALVTMHELGHALGLEHHPGGIMQKGISEDMRLADWDCPDPETVGRLQMQLGTRGMRACAAPTW